jgi:hypothetical protein
VHRQLAVYAGKSIKIDHLIIALAKGIYNKPMSKRSYINDKVLEKNGLIVKMFKAYDVVIIDRIQTADMSPSDFAQLKLSYPNTSFVLYSTKNESLIGRIKHYFLTYKDMPDEKTTVKIPHMYNREEAHEVIQRSMKDYIKR